MISAPCFCVTHFDMAHPRDLSTSTAVTGHMFL